MCLVAISIAQHPRFPWVIASNRDEFFARPTAPLAWWQPAVPGPAVLSGRDLAAGGTWLGLTARGALALLTNVREPGRFDALAPSRGELVLQALQRHPNDAAWLREVAQVPRNGYNLLLADLQGDSAAWMGNRPQLQQRALGPGLYGLSNAALDTPWPKVRALKQRLLQATQTAADAEQLAARAFAALADAQPAHDAELPATGVPLLRERQLSPAFIRIADGAGAAPGVYGTRCSTVLVVEQGASGRSVTVIERRFDDSGAVGGETREVFSLRA
jgi:uncharacterized protein with NRDE domain